MPSSSMPGSLTRPRNYDRRRTFKGFSVFAPMAASNIFNEVLDRVRAVNACLIASGMLPGGIDQWRVIVEQAGDPTHGDMATHAGMGFAKGARLRPPTSVTAAAYGVD